MSNQFYVEIIWTPERLVHEAATLEVFLNWALDSAQDVDDRIRLASFVEKGREVHDLITKHYTSKEDRKTRLDSIRKFYEKNWPKQAFSSYSLLSFSYSIIGSLAGGKVEGGAPLSDNIVQQIELLRKDILELLHEWQERGIHKL